MPCADAEPGLDEPPEERPRTTIRGASQLLVEGRSYIHFVSALTKEHSIASPELQDFGGVNELSSYLAAFVRAPGFERVERLGVLRDAEGCSQSAFQSVQGSLEKAGLAVPKEPGHIEPGQGPGPATGPARSSPSVGVLIVPGQGSGMLETVLCRTFAGTPIDTCIDEFLECVSAAGTDSRRPHKARAAAYLATRADPGLALGVAAKKGYWDLRHEALKPLVDFVAAVGEGTGRRSALTQAR